MTPPTVHFWKYKEVKLMQAEGKGIWGEVILAFNSLPKAQKLCSPSQGVSLLCPLSLTTE